MNAAEEKRRIRENVWRILEEKGYARPPLPVRGRIPNFLGAEAAAAKLVSTDEFRNARVVKVSPDSPQRPVREACLRMGKTLITPSPRIRHGFYLLDPDEIGGRGISHAATIRGMFSLGRQVEPESLGRIDLIVVGSVAVARDGARVGKGEGYSELEYAILRMLGKVGEDTPIATTVHPAQLVWRIPVEPFDVSVDIAATTSSLKRFSSHGPRPQGILWEMLDSRKIDEIPLLRRLKSG
jgi:5-formyltetrahydrofolate cyclo-ligase